MMKRESDKGNNKCIKEFQNIFMASYNKFIRYAYAISGDRQTAQDVVQEAFLFAYEIYKNRRDISEVIPYIYNFIRNECMRYLKVKSVEKIREKIYNDSMVSNVTMPEEFLFKREIQHQVIDIINNLEPFERRIIILKYYCKFSIEDIASTMEMNPDDIAVLLTKIKQKILKKFSNDKR